MSSEAAIANAFTAHGALTASAWAVIFPLGAILIRVIPSTKAWVIHGGVMLFGLALFTPGVALGIWRLPADGYTITSTGHTLLGVIIIGLVWTQPISGLVHHTIYKQFDRRTAISALHVFIGRLLITIGMINAGFGIGLGGGSSRAENIAYGVIVGVIWVAYLYVSFTYEAKRDNVLARKAASIGSQEKDLISNTESSA